MKYFAVFRLFGFVLAAYFFTEATQLLNPPSELKLKITQIKKGA